MSTDEKKYVSNHVLYEIFMYQRTLLSLLDLKEIFSKIINAEMIKNALFESHMLHLRNMFCFFYNKKQWEDDIIFLDITGESLDDFYLYTEYQLFKDIINKNITHISKKRTEEDNINANKVNFLIYCFYSRTTPSEYIGLGKAITTFLNKLQSSTLLPQSIVQELETEKIKSLFKTVVHDNDILMNLKKYFKIDKTVENKIHVTHEKLPIITYKGTIRPETIS